MALTDPTPEQYHTTPSLNGNYQYTTIKEIVINFLLTVVGDDNHIKHVDRDVVVFHAKRGLQELNYDALKEINKVEYELSDTLTMILPDDYVKYVRISWVDSNGQFHPMVKNEDTAIAKAYLQDTNYEILFDTDGEVLLATKNTYDDALYKESQVRSYTRGADVDCHRGGRFGLQTDKANNNGWFTIDKRSGVIKFGSAIGSKIIVLEYISDGLEYASLSDIKVNKLAEDALMKYIESAILEKKDKTPEYVVKRKMKAAHVAKLKVKNRLSGLNYEELLQVLRGKDKRLK